ncbi:copper homeostasis protein CutC [Weissella halotolerans]|uniref:Copper homeostasis protein cutC homolog n=1 Tax=Weissella halotolerans DSM 20190 TaxID=1123500 RepID=A0A0R2FXX4_9LACO|nr:copper homeostasis protein CutC [Weissella halotolerans]KRN32475.1 cytoplasmic copper homeostasis protein cutc [Weissella halotolerans DSM 20190]
MLKEMPVADLNVIQWALDQGIDRLELNTNLAVGGLTPRDDLVRNVLALAQPYAVSVVVMVRPRAGNFYYNHRETEMMLATLKRFRALGVQSVTFGAVTGDGYLDRATMLKLIEAAAPMQVVCHMAFDAIRFEYQEQALIWLADHGVKRVLTHGGPLQVPITKTLAHLQTLCRWAPEKMEILPGGGITGHNYKDIVGALGVQQVHGSRILSQA